MRSRLRAVAICIAIAVTVLGGQRNATHALFASEATLVPSDAFRVDGFLGKGSELYAALKSERGGSTHLVATGDLVNGIRVTSVSADRAWVSFGDRLQPLDLGDVLITLENDPNGGSAADSLATAVFLDPVGLVAVVGAVASTPNRESQVTLHNYNTGTRSLIGPQERAFGFQAKAVTAQFAILAADGPDLQGPEVEMDSANTAGQIPELADLSLPDRQHWLTRWRAHLARLGRAEQALQRRHMREYWMRRTQSTSWQAVLAKLRDEDQNRLRQEISDFWR